MSAERPDFEQAKEIAEAALSEIERLADLHSIMLSRTSLAMLADGFLALQQQLEEAQREIDRLREALEAIERGEDENPALVASNALEEEYGLGRGKP